MVCQPWERVTEAGGGRWIQGEDNQNLSMKHEDTYFLNTRAPHERKEAGTIPSAAKGAASPWFPDKGSNLLVVK